MSSTIAPRRIKVDGFSDNDVQFYVAVMQLKTGQVGLAVDGTEPTVESLVHIHQLLIAVVNEMDVKIKQLVLQTTPT